MFLGALFEKCDFVDTAPHIMLANALSQVLYQIEEAKVVSFVPIAIDSAQMVLNVKDIIYVGFKWLSTFNFFTLGNLLARISLLVARLHVIANLFE